MVCSVVGHGYDSYDAAMTNDTPPAAAREPNGAAAAFEFAQWSLSDQMRSVDASDTKVSATLSAAVAMAGFYAALISFAADGASAETRVVAFGASAAVVVLLILTVIFFFLAYAEKAWQAGPTTERLMEVAAEFPDEIVREWLARELMESVDQNSIQLAEKAKWAEWALRAAVGEALAVTVGAVVVALWSLA